MVLVTTEYSIFNIMNLFSSTPCKEVRMYRYDGVEFSDFDGAPPTPAVHDAIMKKIEDLDVPLQR